jgi:hypothetical protein
MRASTAFFVGVGTVTVAIVGGLGGGLLIADAISPKAKSSADLAQFQRSDSLPTFMPVPHVGASLAFIDPAVDGSAPAAAHEARTTAPAPSQPAPRPTQAAAVTPSHQAAKQDETATPVEPAVPKEPASQPAPSARQTPNPADAYAKAHDADAKKFLADKHRTTRAQRWHRRDQRDQDQANSDQQARSNDSARDDSTGPRGNRYSERNDSGWGYSDSYARRYRGDSRPRYRNIERYDWGEDEWRNRDDAPRVYDLPEVQLLAPE